MIKLHWAAALLCSASALAMAATCAQAADDAGGATAVEGVVVTAPREETAAREEQYKAPNIVDVQSAETIAKYPDFNAAEALGRMPGVTLSSDTVEGRFVEIRGIDGNLNGATYGGVVLLNTNPGGTQFGSGRAVEFDTIPTGAIDGIIVTKTGLPDHEAEGLGGSIELTPRTAVNISRPFLDATLGWGYEPDHDHTGPFSAELAAGARFGFDDGRLVVEGVGEAPHARVGWLSNPTPFSFVVTASRRDDRRGFDDLEEDYLDLDPTDPDAAGQIAQLGKNYNKAFDDLQLRRYDYHRRRFGYGGEFDFQPNEDHSYYVRASIAGYIEAVQKNRLTYDSLGDNGVPDPANPNGFATTADLTIKGTDEQETHRNQVYVVGGKDQFGGLALDYRAAYSRATFNVGYNYGTTFKGPKGVGFTYDNITDPDFPRIAITDGTDPNVASAYKLSGLSNSEERDVDQEWSYAVNTFFPVHLINDSDAIKLGAEVRLRDKTATPYTEDFELPDETILLSTMSSAPDTHFYDDHYTNGPIIDRYAIRKLARGGGAVSDGLVPDLTGYFRAKEDIYAGYGQYTATIDKWGVLAGVRVEKTQARYGSYDFDQDGNLLGFTRRPADYTNAFPTVQLRYSFTPEFIARATYSTGIGRPGFSQVASSTTIDTDNDIITTGNPDLKPTTGDNFDFSLEYYLPEGGIVQFGAFDKQFDNYIVSRTRVGTDPRLPGVSSVRFFTYDNVSAWARGMEVAYHQKFTWLPHPFQGLGIEANATAVDSEVQLRSGEKHLLPATSRLTYNIAGFYEAYGAEVRLAGEFVSHSLFSIGDGTASDVLQDDRFTLDLTASYQVTPTWNVYFNAKNLTDEPLRYYEGASNRPIQREFYDVTFEGGVRARF